MTQTFHEARFGASEKPPTEFVAPLSSMCLGAVAEHFAERPSFAGVPAKFRKRLCEMLPMPPELPLHVSAPLVSEEDYWKRLCMAKWPSAASQEHDHSWKVMYFEKLLEEHLEGYDGSPASREELLALLQVSKDFVFKLKVRQFIARGEVAFLFEMLPNLYSFSVTYGSRSVGMEYDRTAFGMKLGDCEALAKAVLVTPSLTSLKLNENLLDDEKVRRLTVGLRTNNTLTDVDLSHNMISDRGVRSLCKWVAEGQVLQGLVLNDNRVYAEGAKYIGRALQVNSTLLSLSLRLNRLGDKGGRYVFEGLKTNPSLVSLSLSGNGLEAEAARVFGAMARVNSSLQKLDLSGNKLADDGGQVVRAGLDENRCLTSLDVRGNGLSRDLESSIRSAVAHNFAYQRQKAQQRKAAARAAQLDAAEADA